MNTQEKTSYNIPLISTLILMIALGGFMVSDMYLPALPTLATYFHVTANKIQLTITVYFFGCLFSTCLFGPLSDRIGRRPIMLTGLILMALGTWVCWIATDFTTFMSGRIIQGFAAGAGFVIMRTVFRDMLKGHKLAILMSYISIIVGICPAIAPALGGLIVTHFGWQMIFSITGIYYIILILLSFYQLPETLPKKTQLHNRTQNITSQIASALTHKEFIFYCITTAALYAGLLAFVTASPIIIETHLHYTPATYGVIILIISLLGQTSKIYNTKYIKQKGYLHMIHCGLGLVLLATMAIILCALLHLYTIFAFALPLLIYIAAISLVFSNISTAALSLFTNIIGIGSATYATLQMLGGTIGSALMSHLSENTLLPLSLVILGCAIVAITSYSLARTACKKA